MNRAEDTNSITPTLSRVRDYWDAFLHDQTMSSAEPGSPQWFADLADYRYSKLLYFGDAIRFDQFADKKLLEIGCGVGLDLARFAAGGAHVSGIELAPRAAELGREHLRQQHLSGTIEVMNGERTSFADESFDVVYAHGVLPYTEQPQAIVDEAFRVLRPGGIAILMVYHRDSWMAWMSRLTGTALEHQHAPVFRMFSRPEATRLLAQFRSIEIATERFPVATRLHHGPAAMMYNHVFVTAFNSLPRRLTRNSGFHLILRARKE